MRTNISELSRTREYKKKKVKTRKEKIKKTA